MYTLAAWTPFAGIVPEDICCPAPMTFTCALPMPLQTKWKHQFELAMPPIFSVPSICPILVTVKYVFYIFSHWFVFLICRQLTDHFMFWWRCYHLHRSECARYCKEEHFRLSRRECLRHCHCAQWFKFVPYLQPWSHRSLVRSSRQIILQASIIFTLCPRSTQVHWWCAHSLWPSSDGHCRQLVDALPVGHRLFRLNYSHLWSSYAQHQIIRRLHRWPGLVGLGQVYL